MFVNKWTCFSHYALLYRVDPKFTTESCCYTNL